MKLQIFLIFYFFLTLFVGTASSQTDPAPWQIPLSQDFGNNYFNSSTLPGNCMVWRVAGAPSTTQAAAASSTPTADETVDTASVVKGIGKGYGYSGNGVGGVNVNNGQLYLQTSSGVSGTDQLVMGLNITGYTNVKVSYEIEMLNPQPKKTGIVFQFRVGNSGPWTVVDSTYFYSITERSQNQIDYFINLSLGASVNNQSVVQLRWATVRSATPVGSASCGLAIDNIIVSGDPLASPQYFRSIASGNWNDINIWESSADNINWLPATAPPSSGDLKITIRNPDFVNTNSITNLVVNEVNIEEGGTLRNSWGTALAIGDGPSQVDLQVDGTFEDSSNVSVVWVNTARWQLGTNGTFIKTYNTNSTNWQLKYFNGIANIPASSNWICRKAAGSNVEPSISTTNGGPPFPQATYGNLFIENNAVTWNSNALCKFSGSNNTPLIRGNLYIGGNGTNALNFLIANTYSGLVNVVGDIIIKSGCSLRNEGTGIEIQGNLFCNGTLTYGSSLSTFSFRGNTDKNISGTGIINTWRMELNKSAGNINVLSTANVFGTINLVNGLFNTTTSALINMKDNSSVSNVSNASFVNGPMLKTGNDAFIFPVGKDNFYRPIGIDAGTTTITDVFLAEYFHLDPHIAYGNALDPTLDHISYCEYWTLIQQTGNSQNSVTLSWDLNSCGVTTPGDLRVARWNNSLWANEGNAGTSVSGSQGTVTSNVTGGFGPFTLASVTFENPLPVELISFSAEEKEGTVETQWVTASETNNNYFIVEKSRDGIQFVTAGQVEGAGNSTSIINYLFTDNIPFQGLSYYRLKQVDFDGRFTYSDIVPVKVSNGGIKIVSIEYYLESDLKIFVVGNMFNPADLTLTDVHGKLLFKKSLSPSPEVVEINIPDIADGIYLLHLSTSSESVVRKFLIKR